MADNLVLLDTSILIDFYRKADKSKSIWVSLTKRKYQLCVSSITKYEILAGVTESQSKFWDSVFDLLTVLPFDELTVDTAVIINAKLKRKRKQIHIADLFIAATAVTQKCPIATLNKKHFDRIESLIIVE